MIVDAGGKAMLIQADIANTEAVDDMIKNINKEYGKIRYFS